MIGRAAHIACLDSEVFLNKFFSVMGWKFFVWSRDYVKFYRLHDFVVISRDYESFWPFEIY